MSAAGHNNPPAHTEAFRQQVDRFKQRAAEIGDITAENAAKVRDEIGYGANLAKEIDKQREEDKRPHLDAGRKIDGAYRPLIGDADDVTRDLKKRLGDWMRVQEAEAKRVAEEAARIAHEAEEAASKPAEPQEDAFLAATATPPPDPVTAVADAKVAALGAKAAARVGSDAGGYAAVGLRTKRAAQITDPAALAAHYVAQKNTDLLGLLQRLADADIRHAKGAPVNLPGVEVLETRGL